MTTILVDAHPELAEGVGLIEEWLACEKREVEGSTTSALPILHVHATKREGPLELVWEEKGVHICYEARVHFFRGLGLALQQWREHCCEDRTETVHFSLAGVMLDLSRNAVMRVDEVKKWLRMMALMGLNAMLLYMEDTYTIEDRPYFGYMRGRYRYEELREIDDCAAAFGIEVIPCIQTLAHLQTALQWHDTAAIRDTESILLAGNEDTYSYIDKMIASVSAPFRSKRIHLGMDEAFQLGRGRYLKQNGLRPAFAIMLEHLQRVRDIAVKYELRPMIWGDMFLRAASAEGRYYDLEAELKEEVNTLPSDVQAVYWDYYNRDPDTYRAFIHKHVQLGSMPLFAGGMWTWEGMCPKYELSWNCSEAGLLACKSEDVQEVFVTLWGDDGQETPHAAGLLGLQLYAEHAYVSQPDTAWIHRRFAFCSGCRAEDFLALGRIDEPPGVASGNPHASNPSKFVLWQDPLLGLFDKQLEGLDLADHYAGGAETMRQASEANPAQRTLFVYYERLCRTLRLKQDIGRRIKCGYDHADRSALQLTLESLAALVEEVAALRTAHHALWMSTYKPHGWEVLDQRYGGLLARLDTSRMRIGDYVSGALEVVEELEEERLVFDWGHPPKEGSLGRCAKHRRIVTTGYL